MRNTFYFLLAFSAAIFAGFYSAKSNAEEIPGHHTCASVPDRHFMVCKDEQTGVQLFCIQVGTDQDLEANGAVGWRCTTDSKLFKEGLYQKWGVGSKVPYEERSRLEPTKKPNIRNF